MTKEHLAEYKKEGWVHIKNVIPSNLMDVVHKASQPLKEISLQNLWTPAPYGNKLHWLGMSCSASYDNTLWQCYKSSINRKIATTLLETEKIYLYNDQVVLKLSKENFNFKEHYDNQFTNNKDNKIHTINLSWILDDFTEENGTLSIKAKLYIPIKGILLQLEETQCTLQKITLVINADCYMLVYSQQINQLYLKIFTRKNGYVQSLNNARKVCNYTRWN